MAGFSYTGAMNERFFYIASAVVAVLIIALSLVWPQGEGQPSLAPFGHAKTDPDYYRMVRERDARLAKDAQDKAVQQQRDEELHEEAEAASASAAAQRAADR